MFEFIIQPLQLFLDGAIGKDRQAKRSLTKKLHLARADCEYLQRQQDCLEQSHQKLKQTCDRITQRQKQLQSEYVQLQKRFGVLAVAQQKAEEQWAIAVDCNERLTVEQSTLAVQLQDLETEIKQLVKLADDDEKRFSAQAENLTLALENEKRENVQLTGEIAVLEASLARQTYQQPQPSNAGKSPTHDHKIPPNDINPDVLKCVDLSEVSIALVGGHDNTRHHVIEKLQQAHGLKKRHLHELSHEHTSDRRQVKEKIKNCDFVFVITGYISHKLHDSVMQLRDKDALKGDVVRLDNHGATGVLRDILTYVAHRFPSAEAS
ncbi:MAG: hypothetical protein DCF25_21420 [Leptolyngbya foveolarum]|uniref:DUF2325 domain-containing protein n=1 Tax=Leptolyngbya foveolarum TaxID=47253 RepID=A0A2W4TLN8_9CYAN|nr:MAG: hypothetical protein DCF25_21420 [Leptolyngbya foveolarum]